MSEDDNQNRASQDSRYNLTVEELSKMEELEVTLTVKDVLLLARSIYNAQTSIMAAVNAAMAHGDQEHLLKHVTVAHKYIDVSIRASNEFIYSIADKVKNNDR
ncbi:hypothetical protein [Methylobacterium sp. R2-1]|uniref:hypothetical protein n=1 Tax=Methylobacterium sp. R2-1 TaxID=2587064 RepID=UPI00160E50BE|nr:hypothetical protein [Methylobacterium sp. R2-1]MBB2963763.1 hypothetical protein [Methylobacterium sp. R2-1]